MIQSFFRWLRRERALRVRKSRNRRKYCVGVVGPHRVVEAWLRENATKSNLRNWFLPDGTMVVYGNDDHNFWGHVLRDVVVLHDANPAAVLYARHRCCKRSTGHKRTGN